MGAVLTLLSLVMLLGCAQHRSTTSSSKSNAEAYADMRPAGDPQFSADEQRNVAAARAYLDRSSGKRLDARYRVKRTEYGYEVLVRFVVGYENNHPLYYAGEPGVLYLSADSTVLKFMPGSARLGP
jgi:hypothetical protein